MLQFEFKFQAYFTANSVEINENFHFKNHTKNQRISLQAFLTLYATWRKNLFEQFFKEKKSEKEKWMEKQEENLISLIEFSLALFVFCALNLLHFFFFLNF